MDKADHKTNAMLLASALGVILQPNEGVIVHHDGKGYIVSLVHDEENDLWHVTIDCDEALLKFPHLQMMWLHDNDDDNVEDYQRLDRDPDETLQ